MATRTKKSEEDIARENVQRWVDEQWDGNDTAFCDEHGFGRANFQNWINGKRGAKAAWLEKVANAFGHTMIDLYTEF